jgi:hypothetical protein
VRALQAVRVAAAIAALSAATLAARTAHADDTDADGNRQSAALALFQEGRRLVEAERYAEACPKFADSLKLDPGVGTMLNLAVCYERIGKTASAWSAYLDAAAAARDKGETERERVARARAAALDPTLSRVTILVAPAATGSDVDVRLDGTRIPQTLWGVATPVDAGTHDLRASAPGRVPWSTSIQVDADHPLVVAIPALEPEPLILSPSLSPPAVHETPRAPMHAADWHRPVALALGGVGIGALGAGVAFVVAANDRYVESTHASACNADNHCTAAGSRDRQIAFAYANVASASIAGGAVALVGAAVVWLTGSRAAPRSVRWTVLPTVGDRGWKFEVGGAW